MSKGQIVLEEKETLNRPTEHVRELRSPLNSASTAPNLWQFEHQKNNYYN